MATITKQILSGSTDGQSVLVSATTLGTANTVHTAVSGTSDLDEIWVYAVNTSTSSVKLTLVWGGTPTDPNDTIEFTVAPESGLYLIAPGLLLQNAKVVKAFAGTASVVAIHGFVNRITA